MKTSNLPQKNYSFHAERTKTSKWRVSVNTKIAEAADTYSYFLTKGRHRIIITPLHPRLTRFNDF
jgi:hypothetical protein